MLQIGFRFTLGAIAAVALVYALTFLALAIIGYIDQTRIDVEDFMRWRDDRFRRRPPDAWSYTSLARFINKRKDMTALAQKDTNSTDF